MSVEFRQRKPNEYLKILRRRKWLIILPVIAVTTAVSWVVLRIPNIFESTTLIVVRPSNLPQGVVPQQNEDTITRQLSAINQVVTSRSSLEPIVDKFELYKAERLRGLPMEAVIERTRNDINVAVNRSRNDITHGFNISFRYRDPKISQAVTADLASKYINAQTQETLHSSVAAKNFFDQQVNEAREALAASDKQRQEIMAQNLGKLPTEVASMLNQLTGLREEQKTLISEVGRLQDRRAAQSNQLNLIKQRAAQNITDAAENNRARGAIEHTLGFQRSREAIDRRLVHAVADLLALALVNMLTLHFFALRTERVRLQMTTGACSLLVWAGVVLAGRWIGHLS